MFHLGDIMADAWKRWRMVRESYGAWQIERGIIDGSFATALRTAWRVAKENAAKAARKARLDRVLAGPNGDQAERILGYIYLLDYSSRPLSWIAEQRRELNARLDALLVA